MTDSLIMQAGIGALAIFFLLLLLGHVRGKYDLWQLVIDGRTRKVVLRLIFEVAAFIVATTIVLILSEKGGDTALWAFLGYVSVYSARSIIGALAGAKVGMMGRTGWQPRNPYSPPSQGDPERVTRGTISEG